MLIPKTMKRTTLGYESDPLTFCCTFIHHSVSTNPVRRCLFALFWADTVLWRPRKVRCLFDLKRKTHDGQHIYPRSAKEAAGSAASSCKARRKSHLMVVKGRNNSCWQPLFPIRWYTGHAFPEGGNGVPMIGKGTACAEAPNRDRQSFPLLSET